MCLPTPKAPDVPIPAELKEPDTARLRDRMKRAGGPSTMGGSLLTGPGGAGTPATGKATLLGG